MSLKHAEHRERKRQRKMKVTGRSVFLIQEIQRKRAERLKNGTTNNNGVFINPSLTNNSNS
jgi:hypothetical protein